MNIKASELFSYKIKSLGEENVKIKTRFYPLYKLSLQIIFLAVPLFILIKSLPTLLLMYRMSGIIVIGALIILSILAYVFEQQGLFNFLRILSMYCFFIVTAIFLIYAISSFLVITDAEGIESILKEYGPQAKLIYFSICFAQPIILPLPEMVTVMAGSAVLGPFTAFLLGFSGTVLGILTMFVVSRAGGIRIVKRLVSEKQLEQYHRFVQKNEVLILAILFIIPVLPDEIISVGAGISGVNARRFVLIAVVTKIATSLSLAYSVKLVETFSISAFQITVFTSTAVLLVISLTLAVKKFLNR